MGNINISNISCNYNVCLDDLYEVDWFSEKNWKIYILGNVLFSSTKH